MSTKTACTFFVLRLVPHCSSVVNKQYLLCGHSTCPFRMPLNVSQPSPGPVSINSLLSCVCSEAIVSMVLRLVFLLLSTRILAALGSAVIPE